MVSTLLLGAGSASSGNDAASAPILLASGLDATESRTGNPASSGGESMSRDADYRNTLAALDAFAAEWRRESSDRGALRDQLAVLRTAFTRLCEAEPSPDSLGEADSRANQGRVSGPSGRVTAQSGPAPAAERDDAAAAEERRRRWEATAGTHLPGPAIPVGRSRLSGVSEAWIQAACTDASALVQSLESLVANPSPDPSLDSELVPGRIEATIQSLQAVLKGIETPPPSTPPVTPAKTPRED